MNYPSQPLGLQTSRQPATVLPQRLARAKPPRSRPQVLAAAGQQMTFHVGETTICFPCSTAAAIGLSSSVLKLMQTFADKQKAERPRRWDLLEYKMTGDPAKGEVELLEVVCNPNAYPNAFEAKMLINLRAAGVQVTTEGRLSAIKSDIDAYVEQQTVPAKS